MSDYHRDPTHPVGRKAYRCIACGTTIPQGEKHVHQTGIYDGSGYSNRFHDECWTAVAEECGCTGDFEFMPGSFEPPARKKAVEAEPQPEHA